MDLGKSGICRGYIGEEPGKIGEEPGKIGEEPGKIGEEPGKIGEEPGKIGEEPGKIGEEPGKIGEEPGKIGEEPGKIGEEPGKIGDMQGIYRWGNTWRFYKESIRECKCNWRNGTGGKSVSERASSLHTRSEVRSISGLSRQQHA